MVFGEADITSQGWEGKECTGRKTSKKPALTTPRWLLPFTREIQTPLGYQRCLHLSEVLPEASGYLESFPGAEEQEQTHMCVEGGWGSVYAPSTFSEVWSGGGWESVYAPSTFGEGAYTE
jgi:hypothetical protein